jgi:cell division protein FtsB
LQINFDAQVEKSIERQRKKQAAKQNRTSLPKSSPFGQKTVETTATRSSRPTLASKLRSTETKKSVRRSVATPTNTEFTGLRKKSSTALVKRANSRPTYIKTKARKKSDKTLSLKRFGWGIFFILTLRLIFMDRGVIDFYKTEDVLLQKEYQFQQIMHENEELVEEIHAIKSNKSYQKQVVRDHLGVIAKDEYLVVFAKDRSYLSN